MSTTTKTTINAVADNQTIDIDFTAREFTLLFSLLSIATEDDMNEALDYTKKEDNLKGLFDPVGTKDEFEPLNLYRKLKGVCDQINESMKPKTKTIWYFICTPKVNPDSEVVVSGAFNSKEELMEAFDSYYKHSHWLIEVLEKEVNL